MKFYVGETVSCKDCQTQNKRLWTKGTILRKVVSQSYVFQACNTKLTWKRHGNKIARFTSVTNFNRIRLGIAHSYSVTKMESLIIKLAARIPKICK